MSMKEEFQNHLYQNDNFEGESQMENVQNTVNNTVTEGTSESASQETTNVESTTLEGTAAASVVQTEAESETSAEETVAAETVENPTESSVDQKKDESLIVTGDGQYSLFGTDFMTGEKSEGNKEGEECGTGAAVATTPMAAAAAAGSTKGGKTAPAGKKAATTPKTPPKPKIDPNTFEVDAEWVVYYSTKYFRMSEFFEEVPEKFTIEQLREGMETEFFEMTKDRTQWDVNEEQKVLQPKIMGVSKGML